MRDEVNTARSLFGQLTALIAELKAEQNQGELFDTLMDPRDDRANARIKLQGLNKLVNDAEAEVEEKEAQVMGMIYVCVKNELCMDVLLFDPFRICRDVLGAYVTDGCYAKAEDQAFSGLISNICVALRISLSKKRKLIAELEAVGDEEDVTKGLENLTVVVARDTATLGDLEHLLARSQVRVALKAGFVNDM
ncbi:hypothetical protein Tco_0823996 [Tanacetum coccineum]|uniref:Uncharacterized protein n=1 Tax=Tanacetum coccineum TaxID=301880 RepID=A0ABQ5AMI9_9ASTR